MTDKFVKLKNESLKYGLQVNVNKTKYMKCTRTQDQLKNISNENREFERVKSFKYIGSTINTDNIAKEETKENSPRK
jgi:hypothetical protein